MFSSCIVINLKSVSQKGEKSIKWSERASECKRQGLRLRGELVPLTNVVIWSKAPFHPMENISNYIFLCNLCNTLFT